MHSVFGLAGHPADRNNSISSEELDSAPSTPELSRASRSDDHTRHHGPNGISRPSSAPSKFLKLPPKIISKILWIADTDAFASLCLLDRQWNRLAQDVALYAHHLSRCPSYALSHSLVTGPFRKHDLARLKAKFAAEVRRNLFAAYLRPRKTFVDLISISANSAAAFPAGEAFRFAFSPNGQTILALSSSRIVVLDATTDPLTVTRELKTLRRPLSASITDDGSLLAVLSSKYQANVYGLAPNSPVKHLQVIVLDHCPKTIAIAHEGTVLAASFDTGIEVLSLAANALSTDRRAVRSEAVDTLTFSGDGSMIVGSSLSLDEPNAVVISAPLYTETDPDLTPRAAHSRMWTTQILFPQISSVCSHVALLPSHVEGDATWLFAYDHSLLSFRAVRTDDTRAGVAYFHGPPLARRFSVPSPTISPSASQCGTLVVAGFAGTGLCLYGVPEKLDATPDMGAVIERHERRLQTQHVALTTATGYVDDPLLAYSPSGSGHSESIEDEGLAAKVDWRQSIFIKCHVMESLRGCNAVQWVERPDARLAGFTGKRLLAVAPGGIGTVPSGLGDDMPVDGSRLCIYDFEYGPSVEPDRHITIEVGEGEPELLIEHAGSMASEVAMERRRTIRAIPGGESARALLSRSITSISPPPMPVLRDNNQRGSVSQPSSPIDGGGGRRDPTLLPGGLLWSQTAATFRHAPYPPRPPIGSQPVDQRPVRANGRPMSEDSWETPPPPYPANQSGRRSSPERRPSAPHTDVLHGALPRRSRSERRSGDRDQSDTSSAVPPASFARTAGQKGLRQSTTMDGMPISETGPVRRSMSQYGALARRGRDQSVTSLGTVSETGNPRQGRHSVLVSSSSTRGTPGQNIPSYMRPRPLTHHGSSPDMSRSGDIDGASSVSPLASADLLRSPDHTLPSGGDGTLSSIPSLRANMDGRLISRLDAEFPDEEKKTMRDAYNLSYTPHPIPAPVIGPDGHMSVSCLPFQHDLPAQPAPTQRIPRKPLENRRDGAASVYMPSAGHHPDPSQRHAPSPIGLHYSTSGASASVPNLLPRAGASRADTFDNHAHDRDPAPTRTTGRSRIVSRAQSMIARPATMLETSAYHETRSTIPPNSISRRDRKARKRRGTDRVGEDSESNGNGKKSSKMKCAVM